MKDFVTYPAIFWYDLPGFVGITFPDFSGCTGQCEEDCDVYSYAQETLGFYLADMAEETLPVPSRIKDIPPDDEAAVVPIRIFLPAYCEELYSKTEKRTVTVPRWLNRAAVNQEINFSETLRDALMQKLGVSRQVVSSR